MSSYVGDRVTNFFNSARNAKEIIIGDKVGQSLSYSNFSMSSLFQGFTNLTKLKANYESFFSYENRLYNTFADCTNLTEAYCSNNITNMTNTYKNCQSLTKAVCGPNVTHMQATYEDCYNLENAVCGDNVYNMYQTYWNCTNLTTAACGNKVVNMLDKWVCFN